jgi:NAD(P)-dependent dehydrogenase (short-subunit alcohol dehydrogenase family)
VLAVAQQGADVVLHFDKSRTEAEQTADQAREYGAVVHLIQGDLQDPRTASDLLPAAAKLAGRPTDLLINNASVFGPGSVHDTTVEQWDRQQAVNLRAPFLLSQALAAGLPQETCGDIINLNDYRALRPGPDHFPYTISKVGLHGLTRSLALSLAPRIRVNEVALGAILPPEGAPEDYAHTLRQEIPTGNFGSVQQVTSAVLFLLGSQGITGQTLCVDGGLHLT